MARLSRSAIEAVSWLEITERRGEASKPDIERALAQFEQVVAMLVALIKRCDR
jgi:hypothetical protein